MSRGDLHHLRINPHKHEGTWVFIYVIYWSTNKKSYSWTKNAPVEMVKPLRFMAFIRSPFISLHLKAGSSSGLFLTLLAILSCDWKKREHLPAMENPFRLVGKIWLTSKCFSSFWFSSPPKKATSLRQMFLSRASTSGSFKQEIFGTSTKTFQHVGSIFQKCSRY